MDHLRAGHARRKIEVGSLFGVRRLRSKKFKAHPNLPYAGYNGEISTEIHQITPRIWKAAQFVGIVTIFDLALCVHRYGESPRDLARCLRLRADLEGYPSEDAI